MLVVPQVVGLVHMGVPSLTHASKFQHGGKALAFEPQETIHIWLIVLKVGY